ncbi:hypothetical protein NAF17_12870 [Mucilaginibacter sp. RB4R14]|uniref:hypothetical protein n=1 Tax=Mucilaginibacter aurantiaciroseus TaxID=2949308 RepID=UPI002091C512|nr:hypothetical protein [Mucilaginibacter aurantiaciroseus]MCO5936434.1 hypothetical protein [Mucilaginibacter aurantiaciroseus]
MRTFVAYLGNVDQFNARPSQIVIAEKGAIIARQQQQIAEYQQQLQELNKLEVKQKVMVEESHLINKPRQGEVKKCLKSLAVSSTARLRAKARIK